MNELNYRFGFEPAWIDQVMAIHNKTEMKRHEAFQKMVADAFAASYAVVTCWQGERLVGCGRMISDGQMYSGIFDVVVDPEVQKIGIGRRIVEMLIAKAPQTCIHLTSTFGNEAFYAKLGFRKHKTAMAIYRGPMGQSPYLELPEDDQSKR